MALAKHADDWREELYWAGTVKWQNYQGLQSLVYENNNSYRISVLAYLDTAPVGFCQWFDITMQVNMEFSEGVQTWAKCPVLVGGGTCVKFLCHVWGGSRMFSSKLNMFLAFLYRDRGRDHNWNLVYSSGFLHRELLRATGWVAKTFQQIVSWAAEEIEQTRPLFSRV